MSRLALAISCVLVVACAHGSEHPNGKTPTEVTGVILEIDSAGLENVKSFVVKQDDETYEIFIADDVDYGIPLGHLNEHRVTAEPVRVELEERDGRLFALSINDA